MDYKKIYFLPKDFFLKRSLFYLLSNDLNRNMILINRNIILLYN